MECIGDLGTAAAGVDVGSGLQRLCWMGFRPIRQIEGKNPNWPMPGDIPWAISTAHGQVKRWWTTYRRVRQQKMIGP